MSDADEILVDAIASVLADSERFWVFRAGDGGESAAEYLSRIGWIVFRDAADAEANGWKQVGP